MNYLDDFVGSASTHAAAKRFATDARTLMHRLGLSCKEHKCHWDPSRQVTALGVQVDSEHCTFALTDRRRHSIAAAAQQVLQCAQQHARHVPKKLLARLCGRAVSAMLAVPYARFKLQHLYACMRQQGGWHAHTKVRLTHAAMRDARWWCTRAHLDSTWPWVPPAHTAVLTTDSSDYGWGAVLERAQQQHEAQGTWPVTPFLLQYSKHVEMHGKQSWAYKLEWKRDDSVNPRYKCIPTAILINHAIRPCLFDMRTAELLHVVSKARQQPGCHFSADPATRH